MMMTMKTTVTVLTYGFVSRIEIQNVCAELWNDIYESCDGEYFSDTEEEDLHLDLEDETTNKSKEKEGLDSEHIATLERLKANQRQDYLLGTVTGSVQASDRLMKELRDIYRSDTFKKGLLNKIDFLHHIHLTFT